MRLHTRHRTVYRYESRADYAAQILRMTPRPYEGMNVLSWGVTPDAGGRICTFVDRYANLSHVLTVVRRHESLAVTVEGVVATFPTGGARLGRSVRPRARLDRPGPGQRQLPRRAARAH